MTNRHTPNDAMHAKLHRMADSALKPFEKLHLIATDWDTAIEVNDHDIGKFIFSDKRYLATMLLDGYASLGDFYQAVETALEKHPQSVCDEVLNLAQHKPNLINYPVNGETIRSVAAMNSSNETLSPHEIYRLNVLFGALITDTNGTVIKSALKNIFKAFTPGINSSNEARLIQRNLLALGVSKWSPDTDRPKTPIIAQAQHTIDAYLKFYLDIFTDFSTGDEDDTRLFSIFTSTDKNLMSAFASYIIFRHGLTTSSAYKFSDHRLESLKRGDISDHAVNLLQKYFLPSILNPISDRRYPKGFEHLNEYDPEMDARATEILDTTIEKQSLDIINEYRLAAEVKVWLKKDGIKDIHKLLKRNNNLYSPEQVSIPETTAVMTSFTSHSALIQLQLPEASYLTLDINESGIFGIPLELYRKQPHIEAILLSKILAPLIPQEKYNWKPLPKPSEKTLPPTPFLLKQKQEFYQTDAEIDVVEKKFKKEQHEKTQVALKQQEFPYPEKPPYPPKIILNIDDDTLRAELEKTFGKKSGNQYLDEVRGIITDFGNGWKPSLKLWNSNVDANTVRVRWGKYRLKFKMLGDNCYEFEGIPRRDEAY